MAETFNVGRTRFTGTNGNNHGAQKKAAKTGISAYVLSLRMALRLQDVVQALTKTRRHCAL
jgi:hypothetical protein